MLNQVSMSLHSPPPTAQNQGLCSGALHKLVAADISSPTRIDLGASILLDATASRDNADLPQGLADLLRRSTHSLHLEAERTGIINQLLRGQATHEGYALLLRNLLPAYQRMEGAFERQRFKPGVRLVAQPALYRAKAIRADLHTLSGPDWESRLSELPSAKLYAARVDGAARGTGARLIAHAYVRYLGDLSGGQILKRLLARSLDLSSEALSFYDFEGGDTPEAVKSQYRAAIDKAALEIGAVQEVIDEAAEVFRLNINLSQEVMDFMSRGAMPDSVSHPAVRKDP